MDGLRCPMKREAVADFWGLAMVGSPVKIRAKLEVLIEQTQADELIFTSEFCTNMPIGCVVRIAAKVMKG